MTDIDIRKTGRAGRITLNRPDALNALTWDMLRAIAAILPDWQNDPGVDLIVIDATGDRAFCSGGDIADIYRALAANDFDVPRQFWRDEYRLNAALFNFPKPVVSFLQGFTMGGGVGIGCHASHRVVCENSRIAMPECSIGLVPDVGGSLLLARAPGRIGEYLGTTGARMDAGDAIFAGFADYFIPAAQWPALIGALQETGDWTLIDQAATKPPVSPLAALQPGIDQHFTGERLRDIATSLETADDDWSAKTLERLKANAPLAMACAIELIHRARARDRIEEALISEFRYTYRAAEQGDFREGIRAAIIDKDKSPRWTHDDLKAPHIGDISTMLRPLGAHELTLEIAE
jgi:enoyl-CoA hydratase/carnithine racemase